MQERKSVRRKNDRAIKPLPILVFWRNNTKRFEADIYDVSEGGCFLNTSGEAARGERIALEIPTAITNGKVVELEGIVVPQTRELKGFGMQFDSLNENQRSFIKSLIDGSAKQPDERDKV